jgi:hypothetical protein
VIWVGGVVFAVLMALSGRYGFSHDELYFLACAQHLQASYVDQPVLTPLLAWVSLKLFGVSLPGLRVWPALAAWATVMAGGAHRPRGGGARRAGQEMLLARGHSTRDIAQRLVVTPKTAANHIRPRRRAALPGRRTALPSPPWSSDGRTSWRWPQGTQRG